MWPREAGPNGINGVLSKIFRGFYGEWRSSIWLATFSYRRVSTTNERTDGAKAKTALQRRTTNSGR
jgi:hypothetical protein